MCCSRTARSRSRDRASRRSERTADLVADVPAKAAPPKAALPTAQAVAAVADASANAAEHRIEASWWLATQSQIIAHVTPEFEPLFRAIPADTYFEAFSSTRSHMLNEEGNFIHPAPAWPCIRADSTYLAEVESLLAADASEGWHRIDDLRKGLKRP